MIDTTTRQTTYLTVGEIAEDLRVARMTVYRMIHAGTLRAICLGRRTYRVPVEEYARYRQQLDAEADQRQQRTTSVPHIPGQTSILPAATDGIAAL